MPNISISITDDIYDIIRNVEDKTKHKSRSAIISLLIRNGYARLKELEEQEKGEEEKP